jgi:hypothetical protein
MGYSSSRRAAQKAIENYRLAYNNAKEANLGRYGKLLNLADQNTGQRLRDISSAYGQRMAQTDQQLRSLGMSNTTVAPTMRMGYERERQESLNRASDSAAQTRLGIMERRTDAYPDSNLLMNILQYYGRYASAT